jgi:hypothetical protein
VSERGAKYETPFYNNFVSQTATRNFLLSGQCRLNNVENLFWGNPRVIQVMAKFTF